MPTPSRRQGLRIPSLMMGWGDGPPPPAPHVLCRVRGDLDEFYECPLPPLPVPPMCTQSDQPGPAGGQSTKWHARVVCREPVDLGRRFVRTRRRNMQPNSRGTSHHKGHQPIDPHLQLVGLAMSRSPLLLHQGGRGKKGGGSGENGAAATRVCAGARMALLGKEAHKNDPLTK